MKTRNERKSLLNGLLVAFSLYSAIPVPQVNWKKETMRRALSFLPLVGVCIGGAEWAWFRFCVWRDASALFYAAGATILPVFLSGGIHLDGLCDTCDALCSYGDREKRLAILKDPHIGAFGVLWLALFLLAETACFAQLYQTPAAMPVVLTGFALARAAGGRKIVAMPCAKHTGLAQLFAENSDRKTVATTLTAELIFLAVLTVFWQWHTAGSMLPASGLLLLYFWDALHERLCKKQFGGITGDLAGFFISVSELLLLATAAVCGLF